MMNQIETRMIKPGCKARVAPFMLQSDKLITQGRCKFCLIVSSRFYTVSPANSQAAPMVAAC